MNVHLFQHVPFESPGYIETWLKENKFNISCKKFFEPFDNIPSINKIDSLIIMGGPMSVHHEAGYSWLKEEKKFIKEAIKAGKKVLGICLGAQLIAEALGAKIYPNDEKEIGWFEIKIKSSLQSYLSGFNKLSNIKVFHWHGETFTLPDGAANHATSEACENQLFTFGKNVMGIQFHFEVTEEAVKDMVSNCSSQLIPGKYVQSADEILNEKEYFSKSHLMLRSILNKFYNK